MLNLVDLKKENIIAIGIDCGFGDVKITINETNYKFPSYIIPFSDSSESLTLFSMNLCISAFWSP